jgi:nitroimidazol reductase NimA-like FMN-containing flavoprotein (pyridoxamine 5'-phosphate oxidase superfamily)
VTLAAEPTASRLQTMSPERCRELLASRHEGRIAWEAPDGPQLVAVSYVLHHGAITFRTTPSGALAQFERPTMVAFEIDDVDQDAGLAWSVLVRGWAQPVTDPGDLATLRADPTPVPWATGTTTTLFVVIHERGISGRTVRGPRAG